MVEAGRGSHTFQVRGLEELTAALRKLDSALAADIVIEAFRPAGALLQQEIKVRAIRGETLKHPEYGHLKDNIKVSIRKTKKGPRLRIDTGDAFWSLFLEYGTKSAAGKELVPKGKYEFIRPAVDYNEERVMAMVQELIGEKIDKAVGRG